MATALAGYDSNVSLLPAGAGEIAAMRGGGMVGGDGNNNANSLALSENSNDLIDTNKFTSVTDSTTNRGNNGNNRNINESSIPNLFPDAAMPVALQNALLERIGESNAIDATSVKEKLIGVILEMFVKGVTSGTGGDIVLQVYPEEEGRRLAAEMAAKREIDDVDTCINRLSTLENTFINEIPSGESIIAFIQELVVNTKELRGTQFSTESIMPLYKIAKNILYIVKFMDDKVNSPNVNKNTERFAEIYKAYPSSAQFLSNALCILTKYEGTLEDYERTLQVVHDDLEHIRMETLLSIISVTIHLLSEYNEHRSSLPELVITQIIRSRIVDMMLQILEVPATFNAKLTRELVNEFRSTLLEEYKGDPNAIISIKAVCDNLIHTYITSEPTKEEATVEAEMEAAGAEMEVSKAAGGARQRRSRTLRSTGIRSRPHTSRRRTRRT